MEQQYLDKISMEKDITFECLVIKPGTIKDVSWFDPNYAAKLMELNLIESVTVNSDKFIEVLATKLEVAKYSNIANLNVRNEIVGEEPYYLYELMYVDLEKHTDYHKEENELANLININEEKIYSSAIVFRNHLPSLSDSMNLCTVTKDDLARVLHDRVHTRIVTWDGSWVEDRAVGDMESYAKIYFDDEKYIKLEVGFLMHNINIWYSISDDYENKDICGELIKNPIEKCIWFSMKSDEYRGNLTLDEVKKIIYLSKILTSYQTPSELLEEKIDHLGRKIINNKYKVLDLVYSQNQ